MGGGCGVSRFGYSLFKAGVDALRLTIRITAKHGQASPQSNEIRLFCPTFVRLCAIL
jgi:hypothetical protein